MKTGVSSMLNSMSATADHRRQNIFLLVALMMISALSAFAQAPAYEKDVDNAIHFLNAEQPKKALEVIEKVAQTNASDPVALFYVGYVQAKANELDKAFASFDKGSQLNDKDPLNVAGKAYVRILQNNPVETKTFVDKALALSKSKNPVVLNTIAEGYLSNKQYTNQALELLTKSASLAKENPDTQLLLGDAYLQLNKGGESVSAYERAAALDPKDATPHYKMGLVYLRSKNYPVATESFDKAVKIDPSFGPAYRELGELYYQTKEGAKAVEAQLKYLPLTENPALARRQLAFYYVMAKEYAKANEIFKELVADPNVSAITLRFYGQSLFEAGDKDKNSPDTASLRQSVQVFNQYFAKAKPEEIETRDYNTQAQAYMKVADASRAMKKAAGVAPKLYNYLPEDSLAIESFEKSLSMDSTQVEPNSLQGDLAMNRARNYKMAIRDYTRLLSLRKKPSYDYFNLGRAYYNNEELVKADSAFSNLIKLQPTMLIGPFWKARTLAAEDPESTQGLAKSSFEKVIELGASTPEKNKNELIEANSYLGYYWYLKADFHKSLNYWQEVLRLKPGDQRATEAVGIVKQKIAGK